MMSEDSPAMTTTVAPPANVLVSSERLAELERYEQMILQKKEKDKERFKVLKTSYSDDPEKSKQRVLKHYEMHKEEINARRREKRRLEREARDTAPKSETPGG